MRAVVPALLALCLLVAAPAAPARAVQGQAVADHGAVQLARAGGGTSGFSRGRGFGRPSYGYRPRYRSGYGRGFFHGLFTGWFFSRFFGYGFGFGFPLWPLWLLLIFVVLSRRRSRRY